MSWHQFILNQGKISPLYKGHYKPYMILKKTIGNFDEKGWFEKLAREEPAIDGELDPAVVAHALGVANEAFEELSDAAAVTSIEDTLVLQKEREQ